MSHQPQSLRNRFVGGMKRTQEINHVCKTVHNIIASFEQILMPFVRAVAVEFMAIHTEEGFRRAVGWGKQLP